MIEGDWTQVSSLWRNKRVSVQVKEASRWRKEYDFAINFFHYHPELNQTGTFHFLSCSSIQSRLLTSASHGYTNCISFRFHLRNFLLLLIFSLFPSRTVAVTNRFKDKNLQVHLLQEARDRITRVMVIHKQGSLRLIDFAASKPRRYHQVFSSSFSSFCVGYCWSSSSSFPLLH